MRALRKRIVRMQGSASCHKTGAHPISGRGCGWSLCIWQRPCCSRVRARRICPVTGCYSAQCSHIAHHEGKWVVLPLHSN
jgi:hypothetical protein